VLLHVGLPVAAAIQVERNTGETQVKVIQQLAGGVLLSNGPQQLLPDLV
jgi:hypothetical protein